MPLLRARAWMQTKLPACLIAAFMCSGLIVKPAGALSPEIEISQYAHTAWRMQDGIFPAKPNSFAQTSDGYVWIGTGDGLLRFDGIRFSPWKPQGQQLSDSFIWSLLAAHDGTLWIGTKSGLEHLVNGRLAAFPDVRATVPSILQDENGTIWMTRAHVKPADKRGPICKVVGARVQCFGGGEGIPDVDADPLAEDHLGNLWISGETGLTRWRPGSVSNYSQAGSKGKKFSDSIEAICPAPDGSVWVGSFQSGEGLGLQRLSQDVWSSILLPGLNSSTLKVAALYLDAAGALWIGTMDNGIYRIHGAQVEHFGTADGLSSDAVYNFFEDREGDLWTITAEGIDRFRALPISTFSMHEGLTSAKAGSVVAARDGSIWIGNYYGLDVLRDRQISSLGPRNGLPGQRVTSLLQDHVGRMWVGIDDGLTVYEGGVFRRVVLPGREPLRTIGEMTEDSQGDVWVVTNKTLSGKLFRIRNFEAHEQTFGPGFPGVYSLAADPERGIWLGLRNGDLAQYRDGELKPHIQGHSAASDPLLSVSTSPEGSVFAIRAGALIEWQDGISQTLSSRNGLPCDLIYSFLRDPQGNILLYMKCGVVAIASSEMQRWWNAPSTRILFRYFGAADGARTDHTYFSPAAARSPDGRLWFASSRVLQMIDPANQHFNSLPPPVHIEQLIADKAGRSPIQNSRLPALTRDIQIDYTALSFAMPQRVRFRYRLDGHDANWQEAGTRRSAFYTNLAPGTYRFHVIACNNDGVWNEQGDQLTFAIPAAWYQTLLFKSLAFASVLCLCYVLYRYKIAEQAAVMRALFDERLEERTRLARELHDTLLQTIQGSKLVADDALTNHHDGPRTLRALQRLSAWLDRATREGRAALESLRASNTEFNDLAGSFRVAAEECRGDRSLESMVHLTGLSRGLHPVVRDEVYRIGYEAIQNACIHSGGSHLNIVLEYGQNFMLRVCDDGRCIDPQILRVGKPGHYGLVGMKERASRIGATLSFQNLPDGGTEVTLVIPGRIAFISPAGNHFRKLKSLFTPAAVRRLDL